jgi:hypothetical protein
VDVIYPLTALIDLSGYQILGASKHEDVSVLSIINILWKLLVKRTCDSWNISLPAKPKDPISAA